MKIDKQDMLELSQMIANAVVTALKDNNLVGNCGNGSTNEPVRKEKTAYQKTEQLLYNYNNFKRIVEERYAEIEELRKYGVPKKSAAVVEYSPKSGSVQGIVLPEESVESAVQEKLRSVEATVRIISMIDSCMKALENDPYYKILEMRYFEGRTQEDIALEFGCSQVTISNNKNRLVKELAMRIFPSQVAEEMMR